MHIIAPNFEDAVDRAIRHMIPCVRIQCLLGQPCPNAPWSLSFSFGRALQDSVLKTWAGDDANADAAQTLLRELARVNGEAQAGEWNEEHPSPGGGRVLLPKLSYSSERRKPSELFNW